MKKQDQRKWNELSRRLREEHPYCSKCGRTGCRLNVHHILPKKLYGDLVFDEQNLIVLCAKCHSFGRGSAHKDGMAFAIWLANNFPERMEYLRNKIGSN